MYKNIRISIHEKIINTMNQYIAYSQSLFSNYVSEIVRRLTFKNKQKNLLGALEKLLCNNIIVKVLSLSLSVFKKIYINNTLYAMYIHIE